MVGQSYLLLPLTYCLGPREGLAAGPFTHAHFDLSEATQPKHPGEEQGWQCVLEGLDAAENVLHVRRKHFLTLAESV